MAACPVDLTPLAPSRRRPLALTHRRLEANRRNARSSTGPRTAQGKARVACNAIKHGFFVAQERWTPAQHDDFATTLNGLRDDLQPQGVLEESCVETIAASYVRMASLLRYENIAALKHHQNLDREMSQRIAAAPPPEAARLRGHRNRLRRGGLWRPMLPADREANAIIRYHGSIDREIRRALAQMETLKNLRTSGASRTARSQKQTHYSATQNSGPEVRRRTSAQRFEPAATPISGPEPAEGPRALHENAKTNPLRAFASSGPEALRRTSNTTLETTEGPEARRRTSNPTFERTENAKTNPLSSMFAGNRHQRRRARALTRRR
jgi:hypothetical protein